MNMPNHCRNNDPTRFDRVLFATVLLAIFGFTIPFCRATAAEIPPLPVIPKPVAVARPDLVSRRAALADGRKVLRARYESYNAECGNGDVVQGSDKEARCRAAKAQLEEATTRHIQATLAFSNAVVEAVSELQVMPERAAHLVDIFNAVARKLNLPKGYAMNHPQSTMNCQAFFRGVADQLANDGGPSWRDDFPGLQADAIVRQIDEASVEGKKWERISGSTAEERWKVAQDSANKGVIVVGGMRGDPGHLGFVFPVPGTLDESKFKDEGRGPFVRDGNEHRLQIEDKTYPSTYGAVKASKAFVLSGTSWYVWVASKGK